MEVFNVYEQRATDKSYIGYVKAEDKVEALEKAKHEYGANVKIER